MRNCSGTGLPSVPTISTRPCAESRASRREWRGWSTTCCCLPASTSGDRWNASRSTWQRSLRTLRRTPGSSTRPATVSCEVPASCRIIGDESRLRQLLGNLVSNALAYTPAGSPFEIIVAHAPPAGTAPARVSIAVVDHGPGISTEAVEHIFERFWRSDPGRVRAQGGSGLGLSIVLAIARAHGGDVSVTETPGGGATFTVQLPTEPLAGSSAWGTGSTVDGESNRNGARAPEDSHFARSSDGTTGDLSPAPETGS